MTGIRRSIYLILSFLFSVTAQEKRTISLAVSDLTAQGIKESEAVIVTEQLRAELAKSPHIRFIERSQMQEILKEQGFQQSGCTNDACAIQIGQLLGVNKIIVGSVGIAGSYTVLSARVLDVAVGEIVVNESIRTKGGIDKMLEQGVGQIATRLQRGLLPDVATPAPQTREPANSGPKKARKPLAISMGAIGLGTLGAGGFFFYKMSDYASRYSAATTQIEMDDAFDKRNASLNSGIACSAIGGALLTGGIVLFIVDHQATKKSKVSFYPVIGEQTGIVVGCSF